MPKKYPQSLQDRAVRMVLERLAEDESLASSPVTKETAPRLGIAPETLRRWVNQARVDAGERPGVSSEESLELRRLRRENAELRRANEILKTASAFFAAEPGRPTTR